MLQEALSECLDGTEKSILIIGTHHLHWLKMMGTFNHLIVNIGLSGITNNGSHTVRVNNTTFYFKGIEYFKGPSYRELDYNKVFVDHNAMEIHGN